MISLWNNELIKISSKEDDYDVLVNMMNTLKKMVIDAERYYINFKDLEHKKIAKETIKHLEEAIKTLKLVKE